MHNESEGWKGGCSTGVSHYGCHSEDWLRGSSHELSTWLGGPNCFLFSAGGAQIRKGSSRETKASQEESELPRTLELSIL